MILSWSDSFNRRVTRAVLSMVGYSPEEIKRLIKNANGLLDTIHTADFGIL